MAVELKDQQPFARIADCAFKSLAMYVLCNNHLCVFEGQRETVFALWGRAHSHVLLVQVREMVFKAEPWTAVVTRRPAHL